jgi:nucleotide-binding universal stress UspA family protein
MPLFQTLIHPTDFDEPSKEAFRVALPLAQALGARVVAFHVVAPPAIVNGDGSVILDSQNGKPMDLWAEYRALQADAPAVPVQYAVVVSDRADAKHVLEEKVRELGEGVLIVTGSHGRPGIRHILKGSKAGEVMTGIRRLLWGGRAEKVVRELAWPVLVVKAPARAAPALASNADTARSTVAQRESERAAAPVSRGRPE